MLSRTRQRSLYSLISERAGGRDQCIPYHTLCLGTGSISEPILCILGIHMQKYITAYIMQHATKLKIIGIFVNFVSYYHLTSPAYRYDEGYHAVVIIYLQSTMVIMV